MKLTLSYGRTGLDIVIDDNLRPAVFRKSPPPPLDDPQASAAASLNSPIGTPPLRDIAKGKKSSCIVINDITRPVPNKLLLPLIAAELNAAGLRDDDIFILNATGTHRPAGPTEQVELIGDECAARFRFLNHVCTNSNEHRFLGETNNGTKVFIDSRYLDADLKILTGLIEPHFMAGYSGGRKVICPGIAALETVKSIHHPKFMEADGARNCNLDSNPLHEELLTAADMAGCDFIVNVVIDEARSVCGVFSGDVRKAHEAGVRFACSGDSVYTDELFDIVITTSAGYPLDKTFYQAVKGICGAAGITKPGGTIIIASECSEGLGNDTFVEGLALRARFNSHEDYVRHISEDKNFVADQWQVEKLSHALCGCRAVLVSSGLGENELASTFCGHAPDVQSALLACLQTTGPSAKIAVVPEGPYVIPIFRGE